MILNWIVEKWDGGRDWIDVVQDRDRWRDVVNAVMDHRVGSIKYGEFLEWLRTC
jgi:hypothetical protein